MNKQTAIKILGLGVLGVLLIQLIPFGHNHSNPPTVSEPKWSSPQARALVKEHCFQCHSNETEWTWYSNIAPGSWLIAYDVIKGRKEFNFSDWGNKPEDADEMIEKINEGEMPPVQYWLFHPSSRMNKQQKQELIQAVATSIQGETTFSLGSLHSR